MTNSRLAGGALCAVQFVDVLGVTAVVTALPHVLVELHVGTATGGLVVSSYAAMFGGCLVLAGRLADVLGHRHVLISGLVGFGLSSLAAGVAPSGAWLVACRGLQGLAAAASVPAGLTMLLAVFDDPARQRHALGAWTAAGATAGASGFLLGGVVTDLLGWRWVFLLNLPLSAALVAALTRWATIDPRRAVGRRLDLPGAGSLALGVIALVLGAAQFEHGGDRVGAAALLGAGALLLAAFALVERNSPAPLIPPGAWRIRPLIRGCAVSFLNTATTSATTLFATLDAQGVLGLSPTQAGLVLLPFSLAVIAGAAAAPRLLAGSSPPTLIVIGLSVVCAGDLLLLQTTATGRLWPLISGLSAAGAGLGLASVAATSLGTQVAREHRALASATLNTAAQLGTALGIAALVAVATASAGRPQGAHPASPLAEYHTGWALAGAIAIAGAAVVLVHWRARPPHNARAGSFW